jgi:hypothetical protein
MRKKFKQNPLKTRKMVTYFNKKDLVKFGNYLLSKERNESVSDLNKDKVTHADVENFLETIKKVE